jgi:GT2 family glycosyltransferase
VSAAPYEIAVLIASHQRRDALRRCLESLRGQTQPADSCEVIVAVDGSADGTAAMVEAFEAPYRLRLLPLPKSGKSAVLNAAIERADSPLCLLLDDDVIASPELVATHVAGYRAEPMSIGIGALTQVPVSDRDWYACAFARGWNERSEELTGRELRWTDCYGGNISAPREALRQVGGLATDLAIAEDIELGYRLCAAGYTARYWPLAQGTHRDQKTGSQLIRGARRYGPAYVELSERIPGAGAELLDWGLGAGPRELFLRRLCIALRIPAGPLAWLGRFVPGDGRKMVWLHFVRRLAFWAGVREAVSQSAWSRLSRERGEPPEAAR